MTLAGLLSSFVPVGDVEAADHAATVGLLGAGDDPFDRSSALHVTCSALVVHPPTQRVLLRWHARQQAWIQVGGHADPGETDPFAVALREGTEETGLRDLVPWPTAPPAIVHLAVVDVSANEREPAHRHADLRFLLATDRPDDAVAESPDAPLRWLSLDEADALTGEDNVRETLHRVRARFVRAPTGDERAG